MIKDEAKHPQKYMDDITRIQESIFDWMYTDGHEIILS